MANKHFVVHNGLTVGPLTIDATTGDISTPGNVTVTGELGVSQIQKNDSSISINDTGTGSTVIIDIDGSTRANINSTGINLTGGVVATGNISAAAGELLTLAVSTISGITIDGKAAATVDDATALSIALGG
jgi:hypothetical protein